MPSNGEHWRERCRRHTATSPPCSERSSGCVWVTSCQWPEHHLRNSRLNTCRASAPLATSNVTAHSHDSGRPPTGSQCASGKLYMQALSRAILGASPGGAWLTRGFQQNSPSLCGITSPTACYIRCTCTCVGRDDLVADWWRTPCKQAHQSLLRSTLHCSRNFYCFYLLSINSFLFLFL